MPERDLDILSDCFEVRYSKRFCIFRGSLVPSELKSTHGKRLVYSKSLYTNVAI